MLEAIDKHGRNWKAIVKAYFPRRTSLSAKNRYSLQIPKPPIQDLELMIDGDFPPERYSLLIRKMEPKCKQSQSSAAKKASTRSLPGPLPQQRPLAPPDGPSTSRFQQQSVRTEGDRPFPSNIPPAEPPRGSLGMLFEPHCQRFNATDLENHERYTFSSPMVGQEATPDETSYTPASSECPTDWSGLTSTNTATSETAFSVTTPPGSNEDMSLFFNDLQLSSHLSHGDMISFVGAKRPGQFREIPSRTSGGQLRLSSGRGDMNPIIGDQGNTSSRIVTVLINSEIPETVNSIVNQIGREAGISIAIHLE